MSEIRKHIELVEWAESGPKRAWRNIEGWEKLNAGMRAKLEEEFPTIEHLTGLLCPDGSRMEVSILGEDMDDSMITFKYDEHGVKLLQVLCFGNQIVKYRYMNIRGNNNLGTIRRLLRGTLKAYRKLGFDWIDVEATEDGGYMWAKLGFLPYSADMEKIGGCFLNRCVTGDDDLNAEMEEKYSDIYQLFDIEDPKSIWKVARHEHGEAILTGCQWDGYFNLDDPEQMRQLLGKAE